MQTETATTAGKLGLPRRRLLIVASAVFVSLPVLGLHEAGGSDSCRKWEYADDHLLILRAPYKEDLLRATTFFSQRLFFPAGSVQTSTTLFHPNRETWRNLSHFCARGVVRRHYGIFLCRPTDSAATWK